MGHESPATSYTEPHPVLLRLRRTAHRPEPAARRRAAVPRLPRHRQSATGTRRGACTHRGRGGLIQPRTNCRACETRDAVDLYADGCRPLARAFESRRGTVASGTPGAVRRPDEEGHALQAARARRRPLLATRRCTRERGSVIFVPLWLRGSVCAASSELRTQSPRATEARRRTVSSQQLAPCLE